MYELMKLNNLENNDESDIFHKNIKYIKKIINTKSIKTLLNKGILSKILFYYKKIKFNYDNSNMIYLYSRCDPFSNYRIHNIFTDGYSYGLYCKTTLPSKTINISHTTNKKLNYEQNYKQLNKINYNINNNKIKKRNNMTMYKKNMR